MPDSSAATPIMYSGRSRSGCDLRDLTLAARLLLQMRTHVVGAATRGCELLEQLALLAVETLGDLEPDADLHVSPSAALELGRALARQLEDLAVGRAWRHLELHASFRRGDLHLSAERGFRDGEGQLERHVGAFSREVRVLLDVGDHVQVARGPSGCARLALALESDLAAVSHSRGDLYRQGLHTHDAALALARLAWVFDHLARAAAAVARPRHAEQTLALRDRAGSVAHGAYGRTGAGLGAAAVARRAGLDTLDVDLGGDAAERLVEREGHVVGHIRVSPGLRGRAPAATYEAAAEHPTEQVAQVTKVADVDRGVAAARKAAETAGTGSACAPAGRRRAAAEVLAVLVVLLT